MLIKKGGITRDIDEKRLHEYKARGYAPCATQGNAPSAATPFDRMNTAELTQKAAELGVDISGASTNKQRAEAIQAHLDSLSRE